MKQPFKQKVWEFLTEKDISLIECALIWLVADLIKWAVF